MLTSKCPDAFPNFIALIISSKEIFSARSSSIPISVFLSHAFFFLIVFSICSFYALFRSFSLNANLPFIAFKHHPSFTSCPFFFKNFTSLNTLLGLPRKSFISCSFSLLIVLLTIFLVRFLSCN